MKSETPTKTEVLVELCKANDRGAQFELYRMYARAMYNTCLRLLVKVEEAEDALQEIFLKAFKAIHRFDGRVTFGAWLKRITINHCINKLKAKKLDIVALDDQPMVVDSSREPVASPNFTVDKVKEGLSKLSEGYRVVAQLYLFEGYDHDEIASILGVSVSTSKSQLSRAKGRLREYLNADPEKKVAQVN